MKRDVRKAAPEAALRSLIDRLGPGDQKLIRSVRAALRKRFPTANELVYDYGRSLVLAYSPTDRGIDAVVSITARAAGVDLHFNHGPQLPDPKKLLLGSSGQTRFIRIDAARRLAHPDVRALLAAANEHASVPLPATSQGGLIIKTSRPKAARSGRNVG